MKLIGATTSGTHDVNPGDFARKEWIMVAIGTVLSALMALTLYGCIGGGGAGEATSNTASLSNLEGKSGTQIFALTPTFESDKTDYAVTVGSNVSSMTIVATVADARAALKINNQAVGSGQPFGPINLSIGVNPPITILVDGPGASKTYSITITRAATTHLGNLIVSAGTLVHAGTNQPGFSPSMTSYTVQAPFTTVSTTVTPTSADSAASVTVNGAAVPSGQASQPIVLGVGQTTITIDVTAPGVLPTTYTVAVTRQQGSTNANLSALTVSPGTLQPTFNTSTLSYSLNVNNPTTTVTITPTVQDATSSLLVNNQPAVSGQGLQLSVQVGPNPITIAVVPQTGNPKVYLLTVNRSTPGNANLGGLIVSSGSLTPAFGPAILSYSATAPNPISSAMVTATVQDLTSTIRINGQAVTSGQPFPVTLGAPGSNTPVIIVVTAQPAGNSQTYTLTLNRSVAGNANLTSLTATPGVLAPGFVPGTLVYAVNVLNPVSSVSVTATLAAATSTMTINGQGVASGTTLAIPLGAPGSATAVSIVVTAVEGNQQTYTVTVTRASAGNANLSGLTLAPGALAPGFVPGTLVYAVNVLNPVSSVSVTATLAAATSTMTINGQGVASGTTLAIPLGAPGSATAVSIVVTAVEGNSQTYSITVNRPLPGNATLSALTVAPGTMTPSFTPTTQSYAVGVLNTDATVTVNAVAAGTLSINGQNVASNTDLLVPLGVPGSVTPVSIIVTAVEGNTQTYTVSINRPL